MDMELVEMMELLWCGSEGGESDGDLMKTTGT